MANGMLGKKVGMTRIFSEKGEWIPVTVVEAGPCTVVQRKSKDVDGYDAVQLGMTEKKKKRTNRPATGHFRKADVTPKKHLRELRTDADSELKAGDEIKVDMFEVGEHVDITGTSKGKGFAGVIKRHGMSGGPGGHGSHFHRAPGSIGQSAWPSKVFKNMRLPGQMGNERVTVQNLEVLGVDTERNIILVRGAVPGANGRLVVVRKSVKRSS